MQAALVSCLKDLDYSSSCSDYIDMLLLVSAFSYSKELTETSFLPLLLISEFSAVITHSDLFESDSLARGSEKLWVIFEFVMTWR